MVVAERQEEGGHCRFPAAGLTVDGVRQTTFEEVVQLLEQEKVLFITAKMLRMCGLREGDIGSVNEMAAVRTFLSASSSGASGAGPQQQGQPGTRGTRGAGWGPHWRSVLQRKIWLTRSCRSSLARLEIY